jgi:hypothetical protein
MAKSMKLGSGGRFAAGVKKIEGEGLSKKAAGAIMAAQGAKKYGQAKMTAMAKAGKKK